MRTLSPFCCERVSATHLHPRILVRHLLVFRSGKRETQVLPGRPRLQRDAVGSVSVRGAAGRLCPYASGREPLPAGCGLTSGCLMGGRKCRRRDRLGDGGSSVYSRLKNSLKKYFFGMRTNNLGKCSLFYGIRISELRLTKIIKRINSGHVMRARQGRRGEAGTGRPKALCALKPNQAGKAGGREGCNPGGMAGCMTILSRLSRRPEAGEGSPIRPPGPPRGKQAHACMIGPGRKRARVRPGLLKQEIPHAGFRLLRFDGFAPSSRALRLHV